MDILGYKKKRRDEYVQQTFRIGKHTSFLDLRDEACQFFGLDESFMLFDESMNDLMSLTKTEYHMAHYVEKYFENINLKNEAVMFLLRPDLAQT